MTAAGPLGRLVPTDFEHVDKYPLRALPQTEQPKKAPVVIGVNWYEAFDRPQRDSRGRWWIAADGNLGSVRGGHAVCLVPFGIDEPWAWWAWFNQVDEGICVSEAVSRCMALLNRKRYQPRPLYDVAQDIDEYSFTPPEAGTSVRAGLDVARTMGLVPAKRGEAHLVGKGEVTRPFVPGEGISANRWATSTDEVLTVLGADGRDYVPVANSWGRGYPRRVLMPATVLERLRREDGELGLVTDR